jgi:hypothetical protein
MSGDWNTVEFAFEAIFPKGTQPSSRGTRYSELPAFPTDIFALAAYLIERGGVYHRIVPESATQSATDFEGEDGLNLIVRPGERDEWKSLGSTWSKVWINLLKALAAGDAERELEAQKNLRELRETIKRYWTVLLEDPCFGSPIVRRPHPTRLPWWKPALALLVIADEACSSLGYRIDDETPFHPIENMLGDAFASARLSGADIGAKPIDPTFARHLGLTPPHLTSFAPYANPSVVRVVPKSHTPTVGCTMRTLTHNVALAPPQGSVDLVWNRERSPTDENREPLNLLLVPFPYKISAQCFEPRENAKAFIKGKESMEAQWACWFDVHQRWLREDGFKPTHSKDDPADAASRGALADFVYALVERARRDCGKVHGVLLPELALDWPAYDAIVRKFLQVDEAQPLDRDHTVSFRSDHLDFLVSGSSFDCRGWHATNDKPGDKGNYVLVTTFGLDDDEKGLLATTYSRAKHHRWRMTGSQISDYALSASLDPHFAWWEAIEIPRREVGLTVFRQNSIFSAMICEDLARSEPCHEPLKSVGPNLVFALLMDGSQLPHRWAARYATSLADDPGSSVLTLTSLGLMERTNGAGVYKESRNIAIWKEDTGKTMEIACPKDAQAVLLTLGGCKAFEQTQDGRQNCDATSWRYQGHQPVRLSRAERDRYAWIVDGAP